MDLKYRLSPHFVIDFTILDELFEVCSLPDSVTLSKRGGFRRTCRFEESTGMISTYLI